MKKSLIILLMLSPLLLSGCATTNEQDPYENINRKIFTFNRTVDKFVVKPVASGYRFVTPTAVQMMVTNFFNNLEEIPTLLNDVLQLKVVDAAKTGGRFVVNSTVGLLGVLDVATEMGMERSEEDFGQTLAEWGYSNSAYIVIPFLGPSTVRDGLALPVNFYMSVFPYVDPMSTRVAIIGLDVINTRAGLLEKEALFKAAAVDEYTAVRTAYLQRRGYLINDGQNGDDEFHEDELDHDDLTLDDDDLAIE